jgi:hypothetical protein
MTQKDKLWGDSLATKLKYKGPVVHFLRTSLLLKVGVEGAVYQAAEKPEFFYVVNSDAILKLNTKWAYTPVLVGFLCTPLSLATSSYVSILVAAYPSYRVHRSRKAL